MANATLVNESINAIRTLSMDMVQKANSGHPGLPMGAAPMAYTLWQNHLVHNPKNPAWFNRDRFVLSAGHGSALLYSLLHLTGYDLSIDDLKNFRQMGSKTPGHPERLDTPGVEVTTGPLGQGFANGVGMAMAEAFLAANFNTDDHAVIDHYTYAIVSDGDVVEGVAMEAAAIAGNLKLGKLVYLYDQNHITLAASANVSMSENVAARFEALNWHVQTINGMDVDEVNAAIEAAKAVTDKPSIICAQTTIGFGSPKKAGTFGAHGSPLGPDEVKATKENLGIPTEPDFYVPDSAAAHFAEAVTNGADAEAAWNETFAAYKAANPELAAALELAIAGKVPADWDAEIPTWNAGDKAVSTRKASGDVIAAFWKHVPTFLGGSADLNGSTLTIMKGGGDFGDPSFNDLETQGTVGDSWSYAGRNVHYGIREHGMGAIVNGMAAHGGVIPFGSTFHVFTDYLRPSIRLAALSHLHSIFVMTHDSIAVGEDGPTHEPIEQTMSLRLIPGLTVLRPADANETAAAWRHAIESSTASLLVLSRQDLAVLDTSGAKGNLENGAYILSDSEGDPDVVLIATGSEVELAVMAQAELASRGVQARVVSMPSWELFRAQSPDYKASVLGADGTPRISIEAGITTGWAEWTGSNSGHVGMTTYGLSAPGKEVLKYFGFTREHVAAVALQLLGREAEAEELDAPYREGHAAGKPMHGADGHS
ncbi:MAG: transketolase [Thermomicrobiales bacterium]|nr:transketolase [Thermomicrobiales bacterium]